MASSSRGSGITREFYPTPQQSGQSKEVITSIMARESGSSKTKVTPFAAGQTSAASKEVEKKVAADQQLSRAEYNLALSQANRPESGFRNGKEGLNLTTTTYTTTTTPPQYVDSYGQGVSYDPSKASPLKSGSAIVQNMFAPSYPKQEVISNKVYYQTSSGELKEKPFSLFGLIDIGIEKITPKSASDTIAGKLFGKDYVKLVDSILLKPSPIQFSAGQAIQIGFFGPPGFATTTTTVVKDVARQQTILNIKEVSDLKPKIDVDYRAISGNKVLDYYQGRATTSSARLYTEGMTSSTLSKTTIGKYDIIGTAKSRIITTDILTGKQLVIGSSQKISGIGNIIPGTENIGASVSKVKILTDYQYLLQFKQGGYDLNAIRIGTTKTEVYGGITRLDKGFTTSLGGKAKLSVDIIKSPGIIGYEKPQLNFNIENIGYLKTKFVSGEGSRVTYISKGSKIGTQGLGKSFGTENIPATLQQTGITNVEKLVYSPKLPLMKLGLSAIPIFKPLTKSIGLTKISTTGKQMSGIYSITKSSSIASPIVKTNIIQINTPISRQRPIVTTIPISSIVTRPIVTTIPISSIVTRPIVPTGTNYGFYNFVLPPFLPAGGTFGFGSFGGGYAKKKKQPIKYGFSVRAAFQGITATKIPKFAFTGIGVRPMITGTRRKRKR